MPKNKLKPPEIDTSLPLESLFNLILNHALSRIGAEAGSLMTINRKRGILQIRSRLGTPKKGRKGEPEYDINGNSIASQAARSKQQVLITNLSEWSNKNYVPSRSENKIKSILSVPIIYKDTVIGVINADSEERDFFDNEVKSLLTQIAQQVAPVIAERISLSDAVKEVSMELSKSPSEGDIDKVLQKIANVAVKSLGVDIVTLYEYNQGKDEFIVGKIGPKVGGALVDESKMTTKVHKEDVPYQVLERRDEPLFIKDVTKEDFISKRITRPDDRPRFIEREKIKSMAALLLPNRAYDNPEEEIVGVLFANYKKEHDFNVDEKDALATFADYAATAILNSRKEKLRREEAKVLESAKTAEQLKSVLETIVSAVTGNFDQKTVLENILKTTMDILQAEACSIYFEDIENQPGLFKCYAGSGFAENIVGVAEYKLGEGLTGTIAKDGVEVMIRTENDLNKYKSKNMWEGKFDQRQWGLSGEFKNLIGVPIRLSNTIIGVIKVENKLSEDEESFTFNDLENLKTIGTVVGLTIENLRLQNKIEKQLKEISARAAHRIGNQLADYGWIETILRDEIDNRSVNIGNIQTACEGIYETTEDIKVVVNEIKEYGKPLRLNPQMMSLNDIIQHEVWLAAERIDQSEIRFAQDLDDAIPNLALDKRFIESLKELLRNAVKAVRRNEAEDGKVVVRTKLQAKEHNQVMISIEDNGPGFPEDLRILEPYITTDAESTGLGLPTVKEVVEKHDGKIMLKSSRMGGACLEILLPIKQSK